MRFQGYFRALRVCAPIVLSNVLANGQPHLSSLRDRLPAIFPYPISAFALELIFPLRICLAGLSAFNYPAINPRKRISNFSAANLQLLNPQSISIGPSSAFEILEKSWLTKLLFHLERMLQLLVSQLTST